MIDSHTHAEKGTLAVAIVLGSIGLLLGAAYALNRLRDEESDEDARRPRRRIISRPMSRARLSDRPSTLS